MATTTYGSPNRTVLGSAGSSYTTTAANAKVYDNQSTLSPRTQQYVLAKLLKRSRENIILDRFAQTIPIPKNKGKRIIARRYENLDPLTTPLQTEGSPGTSQQLVCTDVVGELKQYGGWFEITDQVLDFFDDPVLNVMSEIAGEQAADTAERLNWGILTSVADGIFCGGGSTPAIVATKSLVENPVSRAALTIAERKLRRHNARLITSILTGSPKIATEPIPASYVILSHTDSKGMWEKMSGYVPVEKYASGSPVCENEVGKVGIFRIVLSNHFKMECYDSAVSGSGGKPGTTNWAGGNASCPTAETACDVYWAIVISKDCFAVTPLAGMEAAKFYVVNPTATVSDPLAQKGTVGWKMYHGGMILNDSWMAKIGFALNDSAVTPS